MDTKGCTGMCCSAFTLSAQPAVVAMQEPATAHTLLDMLIPLPALDADTKQQIYTCKHWDRGTKLCKIYERRPKMCRTYPMTPKCGWEGCSFTS